MHLLKALVMGLTQGLTEFIPVSSSGHLILVGHLIGFNSNLAFDTALNVGTLAALLAYFWRDFTELFVALFKRGPKTRLAWVLVIATVPGIIAGVMLESLVATVFRTDTHVAINLIVVAFIMLLADYLDRQKLHLNNMNTARGLGIGLAQAVAVIPGVSRSGITISAGMLEGFDRVSATRFSFLLSAPIIAGATAKEVAVGFTALSGQLGAVVFGIAGAAAGGFWAIKFMLKYLENHGLKSFAFYRLAIGIVVLLVGLHA